MDHVDIRSCVFQHIYNVSDILNLCIIDKLGIKTASTKAFWINEFNKFKIPYPLIIFNEYNKWIIEFLQCKYITDKTNLIINNLEPILRGKIALNMSLNTFINILKRHNCSYIPDIIDCGNITLDEIDLGKGGMFGGF